MDYGRAHSPPPSAWSLDAPSPPPSPPPRPPQPRAYIVDAFASAAFGGNPAGVVVLAPFTYFPPDEWLQGVAAEYNLSETAFVLRRADGPGFALRWFSPTCEVDLCGHATLAAAHALVAHHATALPIAFHTRSGELKATRDAAGTGAIELDFPADLPVSPPAAALTALTALVAAALGVEAAGAVEWAGRAESLGDTVVVLRSAAALAALTPDMAAVGRLGGRGLVVAATAEPGSGADYLCRCFFPAAGISEDPMTGSAQCALAPLFAARLGKSSLVARQLSRRGGLVAARLTEGTGRVVLAGRAVTVLAGEVTVPY